MKDASTQNVRSGTEEMASPTKTTNVFKSHDHMLSHDPLAAVH